MESPTSWLHGCLFRHDFEIIKDASYKSCSRDYSYICRHFVGNKLMWENAAQVRILSLNWWQNPGRVWSHANSAHPPNSHLAPKLKINKAHWNNSLHIGWTWYCLSDPYTSSVRACLLRLEEPWHDETCSRPGSTPFLAELQTTPGGQHCLVQLRTVEGGGGGGGGGGKHAQLGSCLDSELASPWPQHPVGPKRLPCHMLCGAGHCLGRTQCYVQTPPSPMANLIPQDLDYCCLSMAPSTMTGSLLPPWWIAPHTMTDGTRFPSLGWTQASINSSLCLRHTRTWPSLWNTENRDSSLKIQCLHCLRSHNLCLLPNHSGVSCAPNWA